MASTGTPTVASPSSTPPRLLVVLGCTGVGKTKLGLALARRFHGEVISVDSIQVYSGMPIASNQCTEEEAAGVRQHCLSVAPPWKAMHVHDFRRAARALIDDIHARGRTPILVGGTFYWLESLLWKTFLSRDTPEPPDEGGAKGGQEEENMEQEDDEEQPPPQLPSDAPFTLATLLQLDDSALSGLSLAHLACAATLLLSHVHPARAIEGAGDGNSFEAARTALVRHLGTKRTNEEWQAVLQAMALGDVRRVRFVRRVLEAHGAVATAAAAPSPQHSTASSSTPTPSSSTTSGPSSSVAGAPALAASSSSCFPSPHLFSLLCLVDPASAAKLHPNNIRKVHRALQVYVEYRGRPQSALIEETGGAKGLGGLRYPTQAIWLDCSAGVLDQRLDRRIDQMMERGLKEEAEAMYISLWTRQQQQQREQQQQERQQRRAAREDEQSTRNHQEEDATMLEAPAAPAAASSSEVVSSSTPWRYANPLDPECAICAQVASRDIEMTPATTTGRPDQEEEEEEAAAASLTAPSSSSPGARPPLSAAPSSYLGPHPLRFDWERGLGQALGFKEFRPFFRMKFHTRPSSMTTTTTTPGREERPRKKQKTSASTSAATATSPSSSSGASLPSDSSSAVVDAAAGDALAGCLASCVASLKVRTRAYARTQAKWIRKRLWQQPQQQQPHAPTDAASADGTPTGGSDPPAAAPAASSSGLSILRLDASVVDEATWAAQIDGPTMEVCARFLAATGGQPVDLAPYARYSANLPPVVDSAATAAAAAAAGSKAAPSASESPRSGASLVAVWSKRACVDCALTCTGAAEWTKHLASKKHRARTTADARQQHQMEQRAAVQQARQAKKEAAAAAAAAIAAMPTTATTLSDASSNMDQ